MRKLLIGKQVKFRVEYAVASIGREFGQVYVGDDNASLESVANGWAKVRQGGGDQASNHEELVAAEAAAQVSEALAAKAATPAKPADLLLTQDAAPRSSRGWPARRLRSARRASSMA